MTTRGAANTGVTALSQKGSALRPVPKPVSPETYPPANPPHKTRISVIPIVK
jgi:hypothetical protein